MLPLQSFKDHASTNALFFPGQKILLAVSGGKDSVLMAHLFAQSGFTFGIAHCNFNLRADESQRDESFVRMLSSNLGVPFHVTHFKTKAYAEEHKISTQMAARTLRYDWFEEIRNQYDYEVVALAQHQDDVIETVLLNLTRGTGIAGLHGIMPKRGNLVRPMLFLSRSEIDGLIEANDLSYVEDSSNLGTNYARNKIRHHVVPQLRELNPSLAQTFRQNVQRFAETEQVLQRVISSLKQTIFLQKGSAWYLAIAQIKALQPQQLLLFEMLRDYGFSEMVVAALLKALDKQSGTSFYSATHCIIVDRQHLVLSAVQEQDQPIIFVHPQDQLVKLPFHILSIAYEEQPFFEKDNSKAFIDAGKLIFPLIIRNRQPGDKFIPIGMKTHKKLSNFFIDQKLPLSEKDRVPVLVNGNGELIWIGGLRQDDRYKVTASTKKVAILALLPSIDIS